MALAKKSPSKPAVTAAKAGGRARASSPRTRAKPRIASPEERQRLIAEAAYLKAERRAFQGGNAEQDWLEAESEVDAILSSAPSRRK